MVGQNGGNPLQQPVVSEFASQHDNMKASQQDALSSHKGTKLQDDLAMKSSMGLHKTSVSENSLSCLQSAVRHDENFSNLHDIGGKAGFPVPG